MLGPSDSLKQEGNHLPSFYHSVDHKKLHLCSISSHDFKWIPREYWELHHSHFYNLERCKVYSPFLYLAPFQNKKSYTKLPTTTHAWVLCDLNHNPCLWAESHISKTAFTTLQLFFGDLDKESHLDIECSLGLFISSQMLLYDADSIKLHSSTKKSQSVLLKYFEDLTTQKNWNPNTGFYCVNDTDTGYWESYLSFSPDQWWDNPKRSQHQESLKYISRRKEKTSKHKMNQSKTSRDYSRSFLSRLILKIKKKASFKKLA